MWPSWQKYVTRVRFWELKASCQFQVTLSAWCLDVYIKDVISQLLPPTAMHAISTSMMDPKTKWTLSLTLLLVMVLYPLLEKYWIHVVSNHPHSLLKITTVSSLVSLLRWSHLFDLFLMPWHEETLFMPSPRRIIYTANHIIDSQKRLYAFNTDTIFKNR